MLAVLVLAYLAGLDGRRSDFAVVPNRLFGQEVLIVLHGHGVFVLLIQPGRLGELEELLGAHGVRVQLVVREGGVAVWLLISSHVRLHGQGNVVLQRYFRRS